jgi:nucleoprotein TPR
METSTQSSGDHQEQHISVQEMQELKDTLSQSETKTKSLEGQVENLQKVGF